MEAALHAPTDQFARLLGSRRGRPAPAALDAPVGLELPGGYAGCHFIYPDVRGCLRRLSHEDLYDLYHLRRLRILCKLMVMAARDFENESVAQGLTFSLHSIEATNTIPLRIVIDHDALGSFLAAERPAILSAYVIGTPSPVGAELDKLMRV